MINDAEIMANITSYYAGFLALFYIVLSLRVLALRGNPLFRFLAFTSNSQDTDSPIAAGQTLERAVRGHGNFAEYVPLFLILLYLAEMAGAGAGLLHGCAGGFALGRVMHGILFCFLTKNMVLRVGGMVLTLTPMGIIALWLLARLWA